MTKREGNIRPLKNLGQHFLKDQLVLERIGDAVLAQHPTDLLEIGPGTGALTRLLKSRHPNLYVSEVDTRSIAFLLAEHLVQADHVFGDFLSLDLNATALSKNWTIAGNLPYYIGSQIIFRILEQRTCIDACVFMLQKEVAERICAKEGSKQRGLMSPLVQAYYTCNFLFTVPSEAFDPPPNVLSGVIALKRREKPLIDVSYPDFLQFIKVAFSQRRKTLKNSLQSIIPRSIRFPFSDQRAEQLSITELETLCLFWLDIARKES